MRTKVEGPLLRARSKGPFIVTSMSAAIFGGRVSNPPFGHETHDNTAGWKTRPPNLLTPNWFRGLALGDERDVGVEFL